MRFVVEWNGAFYLIMDQVSNTEVESFTTQAEAEERAKKLNEEKGW